MNIKNLAKNQMIFGNKGAVWSNRCHIYESQKGILCGTPALSTNWARIEGVKEIGCPKCLEIVQTQSQNITNL
jgi:hypothetical protein